MLEAYFKQEAEREKLGIPPLPLSPDETAEVCRLLEARRPGRPTSCSPSSGTGCRPASTRRPRSRRNGWPGSPGAGSRRPSSPGRTRSSCSGRCSAATTSLRSSSSSTTGARRPRPRRRPQADHPRLRRLRHGRRACRPGTTHAQAVLESWAAGEWFLSRPRLPGDADPHGLQGGRRDQHRRFLPGQARLDPARHSAPRPGDGGDALPRRVAARSASFRAEGHRVAFVGDVVGTGSSRKSACNSRDVAHRRGHPLRPEQAARRRRPGRADRPDLLQHDRGFRRPADPEGRRGRREDRRRHRPRPAGRGRSAARRARSLLEVRAQAGDDPGRIPGRRPAEPHHRPEP